MAQDERETIDVKRRRQGTGSGPQPGRRAETPARRRDSGGGITGGGGGGGTIRPSGGGGGGLPGGKQMPLWLVILLIAGYFLIRMFSSGGDTPGGQDTFPQDTPADTSAFEEPTEPIFTAPETTDTPRVTSTPRKTPLQATGDETWTVMLYQDADDQILEQDIYVDLNEVERIGSTEQVRIVTQIDRFRGAYQGDGDWAGTRRYYVTQDNDLQRVGSELVDDRGEVNMASGDSLVDFIRWAAENYPAQRYALILSDHGTGWPGGWSDPDPGGRERSRIPIVSALDDNLFLNELGAALGEARQATGIDRFELVGMDACLMGHIEVFSMLEPHARYAVASQETEPALGWAYAGFLEALVQSPAMDGADLGQAIVNSYIKDDQRIVDNQARAEYLKQGSPMGGLFGVSDISASQLAQQIGRGVTLTAVDLSALPQLIDSVNTLSVRLQDEDPSAIASARTYAQSFTNIFGKSGPAPYIDLGSFVQVLKREGRSSAAQQAEDQVLAAINSLVIAEKHGQGKPGATGVSIYFPNSTLYASPVAGPQSYTGVADQFAAESLWDDFLAYHYNDRPIQASERSAVVPEPGTAQRAPGVGTISIGQIETSSQTAAPGNPVRLSADIDGENIGYIYLFVGYYDQAANSIFIADTDYLGSSETREAGGVNYPVWGQSGSFTLSLEWEPTVFEISDGSNSGVALFTPERYGETAEQAVYTVDGTYTYASDETRRARLYFRDGQLRQVFGFTEGEDAGAPREITPQNGDTFTVQEKWLDLDSSGNVTQVSYQDGQTLTFGDQMFTLEEVFAAQGNYIVGFIVEDLDGNSQQAYTQVTVQ